VVEVAGGIAGDGVSQCEDGPGQRVVAVERGGIELGLERGEPRLDRREPVGAPGQRQVERQVGDRRVDRRLGGAALQPTSSA
jgi:hypothetical protein